MTLEPLLDASFAIRLHVATVLPAFLLGTWQIVARGKGGRLHRAIGYTYMGLMAVSAVAAIFVHTLNPTGFMGFSLIHLFIPVTLIGITGGFIAARRHDVRRHRRAMISTYISALIIAGGFTFLPGRIMHRVVFGE
jgi:uncharacterized membrane protein